MESIIGKFVDGKLYEGSVEKTMIYNLLIAIDEEVVIDLENNNPARLRTIIYALLGEDHIWQDFETALDEEFKKYR